MENLELRIIKEVRARPCLYDVKCRFYRDISIRHQAWEEISELFDEPVESLKQTWTRLRNAHASALRRKTRKDPPYAKMIKWKYEDEMSFIIPYMEYRKKTRPMISNKLSKKASKEEPLSDTFSDSEISLELPEPNILQSSSLQHEPTGRGSPVPPQELMEIIKQDSAISETRCYKEHDALEMFFLSMAGMVKILPKSAQAEIKMGLCQLVARAEIVDEENRKLKLE